MTAFAAHPSWGLAGEDLPGLRALVRAACGEGTDDVLEANAEGRLTADQQRRTVTADRRSRWAVAQWFAVLGVSGVGIWGIGYTGAGEGALGAGAALATAGGAVAATMGWRHHRLLGTADLPVRTLRGRVRVAPGTGRPPVEVIVTVEGMRVPLPASTAGLPVIVHYRGRQILSGDLDLEALARPDDQTPDDAELDRVRSGIRLAIRRTTPGNLADNGRGVTSAQQRQDILRDERSAFATLAGLAGVFAGAGLGTMAVDPDGAAVLISGLGVGVFGLYPPSWIVGLVSRPVHVTRGRITVTGTGESTRVTAGEAVLPHSAAPWAGTDVVVYCRKRRVLSADVDEDAWWAARRNVAGRA